MTYTLVADCVSRTYGARRVLSSASLRAKAGEVRAILGRNGEGKSTLLKIAVGRLKPDTGGCPAVSFGAPSWRWRSRGCRRCSSPTNRIAESRRRITTS